MVFEYRPQMRRAAFAEEQEGILAGELEADTQLATPNMAMATKRQSQNRSMPSQARVSRPGQRPPE